MKTKLLSILLFCFCMSATAEDFKNFLVVWAKDGTKVSYALIDKPKIIFTETDVTFSAKGVEVNFPLDDMDRFTYEVSDITAIRDLKTNEVKFKIDGESLLFPSLKANTIVAIRSLNGLQVFKKELQVAGEYSFPLSNLNSGVYLITVNSLTYKIIKK